MFEMYIYILRDYIKNDYALAHILIIYKAVHELVDLHPDCFNGVCSLEIESALALIVLSD